MKSILILCLASMLSHSFSNQLEAKEPGRKRALLIGVGTFQSPAIPRLQAPAHDVDIMANTLTHPDGYGFHSEDLVVLKDRQATLANFRSAFRNHLIAESTPEDLVLIYFSGHGAQIPDANGDEVDGKDETLVFFDSRVGGRCDLLDDELYQLIRRLKAKHIVVILDACHSSSATKGDAHSVKALPSPDCSSAAPPPGRDRPLNQPNAPTEEETIPNLVVMSAVSHDSSIAFERGGRSQFTQALVDVLSRPTTTALTYEQLAYRVRRHAFSHHQTPLFRGPLHQLVFGSEMRLHPLTFLVERVSETQVLASGIPMPGWSPGGVVWIYDAASAGEDFSRPEKAKASMVIKSIGFNKVSLSAPEKADLSSILPGDFALLKSPGIDLTQQTLRLGTGPSRSSFSKVEARSLQESILNHPYLKGHIKIDPSHADWHLSRDGKNNTLLLAYKDGKIRYTFKADENGPKKVIRCLWLHALQRHLIALQDLPGHGNMTCSLDIQLIPDGSEEAPHQKIHYLPEADLHEVPSGLKFLIRVFHLSQSECPPLNVGGVVLSGDGSIFGLPHNGQYSAIGPGEKLTFEMPFVSGAPYGNREQILIFGTAPENQVYWHLFHHATSESFLSRGSPRDLAIANFFLCSERDAKTIQNHHQGWISANLTLTVLP